MMQLLGCETDEFLEEAETFNNPNWYADMLLRIKRTTMTDSKTNSLRQNFKKADIHNTG